MNASGSSEVLAPRELRRFASEICADDPEIFAELVGDCQTDIDYQIDKLLKARKSGAWRDFSRAAHSIKSAARTFGSPLVKKISYELEDESSDGVPDDALGAIDAKTEELKKVCAAFKAELEKFRTDPEKFLA